MTAFLRTVKFYQQMSQSNSFNGNDLIVLFDWGWLRLMNKLKEAWICLHQRLEYQNDQSPFNSHTLADGRVYPYSVRMREYADQNHSEYGHFLRSAKTGFFHISRRINQSKLQRKKCWYHLLCAGVISFLVIMSKNPTYWHKW